MLCLPVVRCWRPLGGMVGHAVGARFCTSWKCAPEQRPRGCEASAFRVDIVVYLACFFLRLIRSATLTAAKLIRPTVTTVRRTRLRVHNTHTHTHTVCLWYEAYTNAGLAS